MKCSAEEGDNGGDGKKRRKGGEKRKE